MKMLGLLALVAAAQPPTPPEPPRLGRTAWIFVTIDHSEWCPAGNVTVDLRTGLYSVTRGAPRRVCHDARLERPILKGRLGGEKLRRLRAAYLRVFAEDVESPLCRDGGHPEEITISNGGTPVLVATSGAISLSAPDDLSCWSEAATALHEALDQVFGS
jgi:hypothetical protein